MDQYSKELLDKITAQYLESRDFNGYPIRSALKMGDINVDFLVQCLSNLISKGLISLVFGDRHPNPHIKALREESPEIQISKFETQNLEHVCAYPLRNHLEKVVDKSRYYNEPFKQELALGEPQLEFRSFDLSVLEFYRNDPRFIYQNDDISGFISISDQHHEDSLKSDRIVMQTFGFCYDNEMNRAVLRIYGIYQL